jgi:hypothetical protein
MPRSLPDQSVGSGASPAQSVGYNSLIRMSRYETTSVVPCT